LASHRKIRSSKTLRSPIGRRVRLHLLLTAPGHGSAIGILPRFP
jgi:hypothetical protein